MIWNWYELIWNLWKLIGNDLNWFNMNWFDLNQIDWNWFQLIRIGLNLFKLIWIYSNWFYLNRIDTNRFKLIWNWCDLIMQWLLNDYAMIFKKVWLILVTKGFLWPRAIRFRDQKNFIKIIYNSLSKKSLISRIFY